MTGKTCYIFGAGKYDKLCPNAADIESGLIIAADGGYKRAKSMGFSPDLLVGDFDSLHFVPEGIETLRHPKDKDKTDMMLAAEEGLRRGCRRFVIYGGLGGRLDHTIANIQLLSFLSGHSAIGYLVSGKTTLTVIRDRGLRFDKSFRGTVSVFCLGEKAVGVTLSDLKYPLLNATVSGDFPIGVSNAFTGSEAKVVVKSGTLLVSWLGSVDKPLPEPYNE